MEAKAEFDSKMKAWRIRLPDGRLVGWYRHEYLAKQAIAGGLPYWLGD
jgi:hypothetical protein